MNNTELFLNSLRALRHQCAGVVSSLDNILELAERPTDEPVSAECQHPIAARKPIPTMGHPNRFKCNVCGQEVDPQ